MTPSKPSDKPVAAYLRLSVTKDDSVSIDGQRTLVLGECDRRGWPEPVMFVDEGVSGSKDIRRPARDDLEARLALGEFRALMVKSVDRLARSTADFARLAKVCRDTHTDLVVLDLGVDTTTPGGQLVLTIMSSLAEFEAKMIGSRVRVANEERTRQGKAIGGPVPYHLTNHKTEAGTTRIINEARAVIVREMVDRVLAGQSLRSIALDLNERGLPAPRKGKAWSTNAVRQILENPALAGMTRRLGDVVRDEDGLPRIDSSTALLDLDTWNRLSAVLARRGTAFKPRTVESERALLDGLAHCAGCGSRMRRASDRGRYNYVCSLAAKGACRTRAGISMPRLDSHVTDEYLARFGIFRVVEVDVIEDPAVTQERTLLADEVTRLTEAIGTADITDIADLAERLTKVRTREAELRLVEPVVVTRDLGITHAQRWEAADHAERRAYLSDAIDDITVSRGRGLDRVDITWRG